MSIVKINAITVPADSGDELATRFAGRLHLVDQVDGFEGFELLRPTDERHVWLVVTRWRDEAAYDGWVTSQSFAHAHSRVPEASEHAAEGAAHGHHPVGISSELWSFDVAGGSTPA